MPAIREVFIGTVRDLSSGGAGVVEHENGQVFFVAGVWPGETGEFKVTGFRKRLGFAELVKLQVSSEHRIEPQCSHHGFGARYCGGCPWQFMAYEAQLAAKQKRVEVALSRLGDAKIFPIWASPHQFSYRNRAQFKTDGQKLGYIAAASNCLVDIQECPILTDHNRQTLKELRMTLPNRGFKPRKKNQWTTLDIDESVDASTVAIDNRLPFRQANSEQNERMRLWLSDNLARFQGSNAVLELFAGSGNFTQVIAAAGVETTYAVEGVGLAVMELRQKGLSGVQAIEANLFADAGVDSVIRSACSADVLVLDPPRDGFRSLGRLLKKCRKIQKILYISCDLSTFCRDVAEASSLGFRLESVQPLDQFPHTPHVELLGVLTSSKRLQD